MRDLYSNDVETAAYLAAMEYDGPESEEPEPDEAMPWQPPSDPDTEPAEDLF